MGPRIILGPVESLRGGQQRYQQFFGGRSVRRRVAGQALRAMALGPAGFGVVGP
jgi:hypothetical protein